MNTHTHLWDRLAEARERLDPVQSKYRVVFEDPQEPDAPAKILVPDPNWMAAALAGGVLPPVEAYSQVEYGCWKEQGRQKLFARLRYAEHASDMLHQQIVEQGPNGGTSIWEKMLHMMGKPDLWQRLAERRQEAKELRGQITGSNRPDHITTGWAGEREAQAWVREHGGLYCVINYEPIHSAVPLGPMTEEQAIEYLIQKDIPVHVWGDQTSNRRRFVIVHTKDILSDRSRRNLWRLKDFQGEAA